MTEIKENKPCCDTTVIATRVTKKKQSDVTKEVLVQLRAFTLPAFVYV